MKTHDYKDDEDAVAPAALIAQCAADVTPEPIQWLWQHRIALGKLSLIAGEAGLGKSQVSIAITAAVTIGGEFPCGEGRAPQGNVIILSAEDDVADTIVPRLMAAGADRNRVHLVRAVRDGKGRRGFNLAGDLKLLEQKISEVGDVRLVIIDPISSYLGSRVDSHVNASVRGVLEPVSEMAARLRIAIVGITHPPKGTGTTAINRFIGSVAFVAAARSAYMVTRDPDDETRRLFLPVKTNIAPESVKGLAFRLEQRLVDDPAKGIVASSVAWESQPVAMTANQALQAIDAQGGGQAPSGEEAEDLLLGLLGSNRVPVTDIRAEAAAAGITWPTMLRAKKRLCVISERESHGFGDGGRWLWRLSDSHKVITSPTRCSSLQASTLCENEHLADQEGGHGTPSNDHPPSQPTDRNGGNGKEEGTGPRRNDLEARQGRRPLDDGPDMPTSLRRCQLCGKPGAERRDWNGRAVFLHEGCSHAWADQREQYGGTL